MGITLKAPFNQRADYELSGLKRAHQALIRDYKQQGQDITNGGAYFAIRTRYYTCQLFNTPEEFSKFVEKYVLPYAKDHGLQVTLHDQFKKIQLPNGRLSDVKIKDQWSIAITLS